MLERCPPGAALLVTADHGQVDVGDRIIEPDRRAAGAGARMQSGEGRFRWLHARHGARGRAAGAAATERYGDVAWVVTREQIIDERLVRADGAARRRAARLGDVPLVACEPVSFFDPADTGPFELVCRHGSLTSAEVYVPLLAGMRTR